MFQSKEIASLKAALLDAQTSGASAAAVLQEAQAELASATSINAELSASLDALNATVAENAAALAAAEAATIAADARAVAAEAAVEAQVLERLASAGVDPIKRDPAAKDGGAPTLARAEFEKLDHSARGAFMASGGKVTD
jgi:hypothetical protein